MRADLAVLWRLARGQPRGATHEERLDAFYRPQAAAYDAFRERLLRGRRELIEALAPPPGAHLVELGGGTGRNLEFLGARLHGLASATVVDLCPALAERARLRCRGWRNVRVVHADAVRWRPPHPVDVVYFSYALTMIPDWRGAIANALAMLRPGGLLGSVDFTVCAPRPAPGRARHSRAARAFWPRWFAHDGVRLDPAHLAWLESATSARTLIEGLAPVPYLPGLRVPFYIYAGCRP
jgi:S-adenosylmethionine-diacylgycerolhomoserine-N-methlytransferase